MATVSIDLRRDSEAEEGAPVRRASSGLTRRAYLNGFSSLLDYGVKAVVLAIVTPLLVAGLGSSLYGVWQVLSRLVTYMQAADGRPTQALKWVIANKQADDDIALKRRSIGSALGVWLVFLPVLAAVSVMLIWIAPNVTNTPAEMHGIVRLACALLVVNFLLANLIALPEAVLRGMNLGYKRMGLQAGLSIVGGALTLGALWAGAGLVGIAAAQVILAALTGLLFWLVVKKFVPWFGITKPSFAEVRSFLKLSVWWFAWTLTNRFLLASDVIILGFVLSTAAVTSYSLTGFAANTLLSLVTMVLGAVTPGLGGVIGLKQYERAAALHREMMTASWLLLTALGSTILMWNRSFISLWVGAEHYAGTLADILIVLMIVQFIFIRNDAYVIDLTLQLRAKVAAGIIAAALSIILSILLIENYGIAGLCLGMIAGRLVLTIAYPLIVRARLGNTNRLRARSLLRPALTMGLMFAAASYAGREVHAGNWFAWLAAASASFGVASCVALALGLNAESRQPLLNRLTMLRTLRAAR